MQIAQLAIVRDNISDSVATQVRAMIVDGRLPPGERINEVHLSQRLGVSRTPLREALAGLANEGALTSVPRIGYFVRPLTVSEYEQLYAIRPILDPEALRLAGIPSGERIENLRAINNALEEAREPESAIAIDDEFHRELLAGCPNRILVRLIEDNIQCSRRYEVALMRETKNVVRATEDHARILDALEAGDIEAACAALKQNMQNAREPMIDWLREQEKGA